MWVNRPLADLILLLDLRISLGFWLFQQIDLKAFNVLRFATWIKWQDDWAETDFLLNFTNPLPL